MKIGIVGGAMKPFHMGHAHLIEQSVNNCDQTIVLTTEKDRGPIKGIKMAQAWFECVLPAGVEAGISFELRFCKSPIYETWQELKRAEDIGSEDTYILYQGLEDAGRFEEKALMKHCPSIHVLNAAFESPEIFDRSYTMTPYGPAKATPMREALVNNDKERFMAYLPSWMMHYGERYFDILRSN